MQGVASTQLEWILLDLLVQMLNNIIILNALHNWPDEIIKYIIFGNKYHVTVLLLLIIRELLSCVVLCMATYKFRISTSIFAHVSLHYTLKSNRQGVIVSSLSFFPSFSGRQFLTQWPEFSQCNRSNNRSFGTKNNWKKSVVGWNF